MEAKVDKTRKGGKREDLEKFIRESRTMTDDQP
jgi:hypothetical protein